MVNNKKGWIKIVEAFLSVIMIVSILMLILSRDYTKEKDFSEEIYEKEETILREIQFNSLLRKDILKTPESDLPINWEDFYLKGVGEIRNKIEDKEPVYLDCKAKICKIEDDCSFNAGIFKNVYASSIPLFADFEIYNPRQLKLFCIEK